MTSGLRLFLVDHDPAVAAALRRAFASRPEVSVRTADILTVAENTLVSPANGQGFMDGGIDRAYRGFFGREVERRVREAISRRPEGYLPLGASLTIGTGHPRVPFLVVVPTMISPEVTDAEASYRAMRAMLREVTRHSEVARAVYCPGLATGVGAVPVDEAASAMVDAYRDWSASRPG